jgi:hypothetical protein
MVGGRLDDAVNRHYPARAKLGNSDGDGRALRLNRCAGRVVEMAITRWTDLIGVAGYAMVVLSTRLLFPDSAERMNWKYWLARLSLWFLGFVSLTFDPNGLAI